MPTPVLLERATECAALHAALDRARAGDGGLLAIEGAPGIGKSRLVRAGSEAAAKAGMRVLAARGGELERDFAHGVVRQLFERPLLEATPDERAVLLAGPARLAAEALGLAEADASSAAPATDPAFAVLHGLYWLVVNLSASAPLLVTIDDAHWADEPSLRFLAYLARRLEGLPVLVVLAVRAGDAGADQPALADLLADPTTERLVPHELTTEGATELIAATVGSQPDPAFVKACHAMTRGNPLLLHQLVDAVRSEGVAPTAEAAGRVRALAPKTIARATLVRLLPLPEAARAMARAVAVLGPGAELRDAAAVAGLAPAAAAEAADALRRAELLAPTATLEFTHPIVRTAVYEDMAAADRAAAHAKAATALEAAGAPGGEIAKHLLAAPPAGSRAVVERLRGAAAQAVREAAPAIAANLLRRALDEPPPLEQRADVLAELGAAELRAKLRGEADGHLAASIAETLDPAVRAERRLLLSRARHAVAGANAAVAVLEAAIADAEEAGDREVTLRLEAELSAIAVLDRDTAPKAQRRLERHSDLPGETLGERLVLANLARQIFFIGGPAELAAELALRSLAGGRLVRDATADAVPVHHAILVLTMTDRFAAAHDAIESTLADARARGSAVGLSFATFSRALLHHRRGDIAAAEADARQSLDVFGTHVTYAVLPLALLVHALVERGAYDEADALLAEYGVLGRLPDLLTSSRLQHARAVLRLAQGNPDAALVDLEEVATRELTLGVTDMEVSWRLVAALARHERGEEDAAIRLASEHLGRAGTWGTTSSVGSALTVLGVVSPPEEALRALRTAVDTLAGSESQLTLARAEVELGALLAREGERGEAREVLKAGLDRAGRCHAPALADRAHEELVAAGARPRRLSFSGAEALTASERRVAQLAASGLANREIAQELYVTIKTVENHLGRAYQKLGIKSRAELGPALGDVGEPAAA